MNRAYVNKDQKPDPLAQQAQLPKPKTGRYTEHTNANLSRNDSSEEDYYEFSDLAPHRNNNSSEEDYVEFSDLAPHRNNGNFNQKEINNKGKFLSLHSGGIAYLY